MTEPPSGGTITGKKPDGSDDPDYYFSGQGKDFEDGVVDEASVLDENADAILRPPPGVDASEDDFLVTQEFDTPIDACILATGGFSSSKVLRSRFCPSLAAEPTTNGPTSVTL